MTGLTPLPDYYFRIRESGALVFRLDTANRKQRIEMDPIAVVNVRTGTVKPHGERALSEADQAEIARWLADRKATLARRAMDDIARLVDDIARAATWAQSSATDAQLDQVTDDILLAMHDLRAVLLRRKAARLKRD